MSRLAGTVVVVTGAAQGQGAAEARPLAAGGAAVVATDVPPEPTEELPGIAYRRSDEASSNTGVEIPVDGGRTAHGGVESISDAVRAGAP